MSRASNRMVLVGIALLFFGPLLLAVLMQSDWWRYEPLHKTNAGRLVEPPAAFDLSDLDVLDPRHGTVEGTGGRWWILFLYEGDCDPDCEQDVTGLRQVHRALGRHRDSVVMALLGMDGHDPETLRRLHTIYARFLQMDGGPARSILEPLAAAGDEFSASLHRHAFLLDPAGNIILTYAPGFAPNDLNRDLKRLLTWSSQDT